MPSEPSSPHAWRFAPALPPEGAQPGLGRPGAGLAPADLIVPDWDVDARVDDMNANGVLQNWLDEFYYLADHLDWGVITYTFHPFVIGRGHRAPVPKAVV